MSLRFCGLRLSTILRETNKKNLLESYLLSKIALVFSTSMPPPSKRRIAPSLSPVRPQKKLKNGYGSPHTPDRQGSEISFKNGAIVKIELKDFMTHQSIVIEPNPKINILSGVNGSGKSSILLGISVGLGRFCNFP